MSPTRRSSSSKATTPVATTVQAVNLALTNTNSDGPLFSQNQVTNQVTPFSSIPDDATLRTQWGFNRATLVMYVTLCYDLYEELGRFPSPEEVNAGLYANRVEFPADGTLIYEQTTHIVMASAIFKSACYYRGMRKSSDALSERQRLTIAAVTDYTSRASFDQKLLRLGVSTWEYNAWMNFPPFAQRITKLSQAALKRSESLADVALAQGAVQGKLDFIKYADQRSGKFDPNAQATLDINHVIMQVIEIIQRNVTDPVVLRKIGGELSLLAGAAGLNPNSNPTTPTAGTTPVAPNFPAELNSEEDLTDDS